MQLLHIKWNYKSTKYNSALSDINNSALYCRFGCLKLGIRCREPPFLCRVIMATFVLHNFANRYNDFMENEANDEEPFPEVENEGMMALSEYELSNAGRLYRDFIGRTYFSRNWIYVNNFSLKYKKHTWLTMFSNIRPLSMKLNELLSERYFLRMWFSNKDTCILEKFCLAVM